jgi:hypothetical protein
MKGSNSLHLNEATMIEAVQEYLDKRMSTHAPVVDGVKHCGSTYNAEFLVSVSERKAPVIEVAGND